MSKPVKEMVRNELIRRFEGLTSLAVVGFVGLDAVATNRLRGRLLARDMHLTVVKNALARQAFKEVGIPQACEIVDGPCALAYGGDSVVDLVRELLDIARDSPALTVKAAMLEGEIYGADQIDALSKYPTRDEAIGIVASCALGPAAKLAGALLGPGGRIGGILKTIEEGGEKGSPADSAEAA